METQVVGFFAALVLLFIDKLQILRTNISREIPLFVTELDYALSYVFKFVVEI